MTSQLITLVMTLAGAAAFGLAGYAVLKFLLSLLLVLYGAY
ncbi:hypothetical protein [Caballeronia hypogeia]|nr:hypothetical protein [Caballeronia hypogeia]